jgi:hypothetical protein
MNNWVGVLAKAGLAKNELKNIPAPSVSKRTPAQVNILNSKQIDRLSTEQKRTYFRQLRELLESMEAVDQSILGKGKKSSSREPASMKNFAALFLGEAAVAGDSEQCVAAGHVTTAMYDSVKGRLTCGSDGKGNVQAKLRDGCASNREFRCNTSLYGSGKICVPAGPDSTALCNQKVSANDIPDTYKNDPVEFSLYSFFIETSNYLNKLTAFARAQLKNQLEAQNCFVEQMYLDGTYADPYTFRNFSFNTYQLRIHFARYQVAPGACGEQQVVFPLTIDRDRVKASIPK